MQRSIEAGNSDDIALGRALISSGRVGCIVLAGGDGSRLGWSGPKGTFPISLVKGQTLFQLLWNRVLAASNHYDCQLPFAVMTSPQNEVITRSCFPKQVDIFNQNTVPLLDENQEPLAQQRPNGNGEVLKCFFQSPLFAKWKEMGVEWIQTIQIDNPLAEPFDPNQVGIHFKKRADVTLKAVEKLHDGENVGVIGEMDGKIKIVEYLENPPPEWKLANTSLFSFSMDFIEKVSEQELPVHVVKKVYGNQIVYKRETFIFDLLPFAKQVEVILYPREQTFAPLKNRDDVGPVQRALLKRDQRVAIELTSSAPTHLFELDAQFHYPTSDLKAKWEGKPLPNASYIEP